MRNDLVDNPLVSIITTTLRPMPYLRDCVESIQAQDYPHVEHIIQDGGSEDGTQNYLKSLTANNVHWRSEPDSGEHQGLNRAVARMKGDIFIVLNGDDALLPHACSWGVEQFRKHPEAAVIYGDERIVDQEGNHVQDFIAPEYDFERLLCVEIVPPAQASFIRTDAFNTVGPQMNEEMDVCSDFDLWIRLGMSFPFVHVPEFITRYRWHDNQTRRPHEIPRHVAAKNWLLDRLLTEPDFSKKYGHLEGRARAGILLWASESYFWMDVFDEAKRFLRAALEYDPEPKKFYKYFIKTQKKRPDFAELLRFAPETIKAAVPEGLAVHEPPPSTL